MHPALRTIYYSQSSVELDNSNNTNGSDQQVWWVIGDSLQQTSDDAGPEPTFANSVYQYTTSIAAITTTDFTGVTNGSYLPKLGSDIYKKTSKKPIFVLSTAGGSEFYPNGDNNNWSTSGTLYATGQTKLSDALTAAGVTKPRGILLCLGINDARGAQTLSNIESAVNSLFSRLSSDYSGVPIYVTQIGRDESGEGARVLSVRGYIENAVAATPSAHILVELADYLEYYSVDTLHVDCVGNQRWAASMVKAMIDQGLASNTPITRTYGSASTTVFGFPAFSGLTTAEKNVLSDFIDYLQTKGDWTRVDSLYHCLLGTEGQSLQDLRRSSKQAISTGSWSAKGGIVTDGTIDGVIRSNFIPSTDSTANGFAVGNNISFVSIKDRISATGSNRVAIGVIGSNSTHKHYMREQAALGIECINNADTGGTSATTGINGQFFSNRTYINRRPAATFHSAIRYPLAILGNTSVNSVALPDREFTIGCLNNNGTFEDPISIRVYSFGFINGITLNYQRFMRKNIELETDLLIST
jgi:hypothetical protein